MAWEWFGGSFIGSDEGELTKMPTSCGLVNKGVGGYFRYFRSICKILQEKPN